MAFAIDRDEKDRILNGFKDGAWPLHQRAFILRGHDTTLQKGETLRLSIPATVNGRGDMLYPEETMLVDVMHTLCMNGFDEMNDFMVLTGSDCKTKREFVQQFYATDPDFVVRDLSHCRDEAEYRQQFYNTRLEIRDGTLQGDPRERLTYLWFQNARMAVEAPVKTLPGQTPASMPKPAA